MPVCFEWNGRQVELDDQAAQPHESLLTWLRGAGATGSKEGCAERECGACAVAFVERDRFVPVNSCLVPLSAVHGRKLISVEGVAAASGELHPVQRALVEHGGSQCGYCTPGFVVSMFCEYYRPERTGFDLEAVPAILTIESAIAADSFLTDPERMQCGDAEQGLRGAELRLQGQLSIGAQEHFYLETQAALAFVDEAGAVFVHSSTQHPTETQAIVARVLGLKEHQVVVQCLRMGGAFGGKETQANSWGALAALAAHKLKRPVRVRSLPRSPSGRSNARARLALPNDTFA